MASKCRPSSKSTATEHRRSSASGGEAPPASKHATYSFSNQSESPPHASSLGASVETRSVQSSMTTSSPQPSPARRRYANSSQVHARIAASRSTAVVATASSTSLVTPPAQSTHTISITKTSSGATSSSAPTAIKLNCSGLTARKATLRDRRLTNHAAH